VATQRQLANPPLREVLIDIQLTTELPKEFAEALSQLKIAGLEKKQELKTGQFEIKIGRVSEAVVKQDEVLGWRYESEDGSRVVQLRRNGITCSILRGYSDFTEMKDAARRVWELFVEQVQDSVTVGRIAARYINVLEFPINVELNDYLTAAPQIPKPLPQAYEGFLQRVAVPYQPDKHAIITQALDTSIQLETRVILDIDVFALRTIEGKSPDLWNLVDDLRALKNAIFFSSVTELALERYA
jgi:uncharacterized protein (TIGR04255 family)